MFLQKYELTEETKIVEGKTLYCLRAIRDFENVKKGDFGGWIEKDSYRLEVSCYIASYLTVKYSKVKNMFDKFIEHSENDLTDLHKDDYDSKKNIASYLTVKYSKVKNMFDKFIEQLENNLTNIDKDYYSDKKYMEERKKLTIKYSKVKNMFDKFIEQSENDLMDLAIDDYDSKKYIEERNNQKER
ncbi:MAG: hypothetical protein JJV93_01320 [Alphaproteobacteria bacterium]|nr:hypothetical protein [Alphaproteobacteria bacterium]MBL0717890.1 hypothetical protein [Alphaproteobacteria bacterium]